MNQTLVEEIAGKKNTSDENHQKTQVQAGAIQFNREVIWILVAFHKNVSDG